MIILCVMIGVPSVYAQLETGTSNIIETERTTMIVDVNEDKSHNLKDAFIEIDGGYVVAIDGEGVKRERTDVKQEKHRVFGTTVEGYNYYLIYDVNDNQVKVFVKVWVDGKSIRIVEVGTVAPLF